MRALRRYGISILIGFLSLGILFQARTELSASVRVERFRLADSFSTPVIRFFPSAGGGNGIVAVLVHGHHCNKAMMSQLARYLASAGIDAYAIDLPGHGESKERFSTERALSAAQAAVTGIAERTGVQPEKLVLIGHSFGAIALGPTALQVNPLATIFIGPGRPDGLSRRSPHNVLIVTGERDYDHITRDAQTMYGDLTGVGRQPPGSVVGDFGLKDARLWTVVPGATHLSLLFSEQVHRIVAQWIGRSAQMSLAVPKSHSSFAALRAAASALILSLLLARLLARVLPRPMGIPAGASTRHWALPVVAALGGLSLAVLLTNFFLHQPFLHFEERDVLASLLALTGVLGAGLLKMLGVKTNWWPEAMDWVLAGAAFFFLLALGLLTIDTELYSLRADPRDWGHLATFAIFAVLAIPVFVLQDALSQGVEQVFRVPVSGLAYCLASLAFALAISSSLHFVDGRLHRFDAAVLGVLTYCAIVGAIFRASKRNAFAGALHSAIVIGWVVSVGFFHY